MYMHLYQKIVSFLIVIIAFTLVFVWYRSRNMNFIAKLMVKKQKLKHENREHTNFKWEPKTEKNH